MINKLKAGVHLVFLLSWEGRKTGISEAESFEVEQHVSDMSLFEMPHFFEHLCAFFAKLFLSLGCHPGTAWCQETSRGCREGLCYRTRQGSRCALLRTAHSFEFFTMLQITKCLLLDGARSDAHKTFFAFFGYFFGASVKER